MRCRGTAARPSGAPRPPLRAPPGWLARRAERPARVSTNVASAAPRDSASIPSAPEPANRSSTRASVTRSPRIENSASRTRSEVGRVASPGGACSRRPPQRPAMTRSAHSFTAARRNCSIDGGSESRSSACSSQRLRQRAVEMRLRGPRRPGTRRRSRTCSCHEPDREPSSVCGSSSDEREPDLEEVLDILLAAGLGLESNQQSRRSLSRQRSPLRGWADRAARLSAHRRRQLSSPAAQSSSRKPIFSVPVVVRDLAVVADVPRATVTTSNHSTVMRTRLRRLSRPRYRVAARVTRARGARSR